MSQDYMSDVLEELEEVHAEKLQWNSSIYPVISSARRLGGKIEAGGFALDSDASFALRQNLFETLPQKKQTVTFLRYNATGELVESVRYQIDQVVTLPGGDIVRLVCVAYGKGV